MSIDKNQHLTDVLETHKMHHVQNDVNKFESRRKEVIDLLTKEYSGTSYAPFKSGSMAKHTAININYDFDIVIPFKRDSFDKLEDMFNDVYETLTNQLPADVEVRKQKVSIGIIYPKDEDDVTVKLDIVPAREIKQDEFQETHNLNLYFNESKWGYQKGTWMKTNIHAQIEHIKGKEDERKIIRLLKIWKKSRGEDYKSFMLELFTIKAMESYTGGNNLWAKLTHVMTYICDHVTDEKFQLVDPGNSNNNVLSPMDGYRRTSLQSTLSSIKNNVETSPDTFLSYYFPINEKFKQEKKQNEGYGNGSVSYPPTAKRFG